VQFYYAHSKKISNVLSTLCQQLMPENVEAQLGTSGL